MENRRIVIKYSSKLRGRNCSGLRLESGDLGKWRGKKDWRSEVT
jgi:hypothetical protein